MMPLYLLIVPFLISLLLVCWIHPLLVRIATMKDIVDNPDARKLQRQPVPVLGGTAVFFGALIGIGCMCLYVDCSRMMIVMVAMMVMLYTGTIDDILSLSPALRFMIEILVVLLLIYAGDYQLDDLHGLWGIEQIPGWISMPLTVFAAVGIMNAVNLIDGVNGLSSGYCIQAGILFGVLFFLSQDWTMTILAIVSVGSLLPFFFHNVFGKKSKMFIGDGGSLVMGTVMSVFVIETLHSESACSLYVASHVGLIPFTLAVMAVPVFDTLRVMSSRMCKGVSPFHPDKTHLHHIFIGLGFTHVATTAAILTLNLLVVALWSVLVSVGASIQVQLYAVVAMSLLVTFGLYHFVQYQIDNHTRLLNRLRRIGESTRQKQHRLFIRLQRIADRM